MKLAIQQLLNKVKKLNVMPLAGLSRSSTSGRIGTPIMSSYTKFLLLYGTRYNNKMLVVGVEPVQHMFIREPKHGIFYIDSPNNMCFQCTDDLHTTPTEHLFYLHMEGINHVELERGYLVLIFLELSKRLEDR